MDIISGTLQIILFSVLIGLVVYLFFVLRNISSSIKTIENESLKIAQDLRELLASTEELTKRLNGVTAQIDDNIKSIDWIIRSIKDTTTEFLNIKDKVITLVEEPVEGISKNITAIKKGFKAFWSNLISKGQKP